MCLESHIESNVLINNDYGYQSGVSVMQILR